MRTVSSTVEAAITDTESVRMVIRATVDPSRTYFGSLADDNPYDGGDYSVPTDTPVGQTAIYSQSTGSMITFVVNPSTGAIVAMEQGSGTQHSLGITTDADTKPGSFDLGNGSAYLWYWNSTQVTRVTVNLTSWGVSGTTNISVSGLPPDWTVTAGSIHALSSTQFVLTYLTSIGGMGVGYYDGSWHHWKRRFMSPNTLTVEDWTIYSTAANFNGNVFVYSTDLTSGEVRGVKYNPYKDLWTDTFVALPADLSRFCITNAIVANGYIHMAGQFHRTEDLADAKVYSLLLRSTDGYTFSWDRFTLLSSLGYQFYVARDTANGYLYASDRNSVGQTEMSHFLISVPNGREILGPPDDIISMSISNASQGVLELRSYDEELIDSTTVVKHSRIKIETGYYTSAGIEWVPYGTYYISNVNTGFADGIRRLVISIQDAGSWKTSQIAFPFYAEILSKSSSYDDCDEKDKMYPVTTQAQYGAPFLMIDFWGNDEWDGDGEVGGFDYRFREKGAGDGCARKHFDSNQGTTDRHRFKTVDLNTYPLLDDYPTIDGSGTQYVRLYGWERTDDSARPNSTWEVYMITAPADDLDNKTVTEGTAISTYSKFPQEYPDNEDGSYPIVYRWSTGDGNALTADDVLLYIGLGIYNSAGSESEGCPERLEIEGVNFAYSSLKSSRTWDLSNPDPDTYDRDYLEHPSTGLPSILFTTKPYTAFNFRISSEFIYDAGDTPLNVGMVAWGVVGLAKDGVNWIGARWSKLNSALQLLYCRDNDETILSSTSPGTTPMDIMLDHRDGQLRVWTRTTGTTWTGPVITHSWDEITNGVMSTSDTGIMHTGMYGAVHPPGFFCTGYNPTDADGIAMFASSVDSALAAFPASGKCVIDERIYRYASKTSRPGDYLGPYQGRQSWDYGEYSDSGESYSGMATEIAAYFPDSDPSRMNGMFLGAENGHTWRVSESDWTVVHYNSGQANPLRNRSRHYSDSCHGNLIGPPHRVHLSPGLVDVESDDSGGDVMHRYGSWVTVYGTDRLWAERVVSTTVDKDATIKDMLSMLCKTASVDTEFPGDWTGSQTITATPYLLASGQTVFPGGYDVRFSIPALSSGTSIALYCSNMLYDADGDLETTGDQEAIDFGVRNQGGVLEVYSYPRSGYTDPEYFQTGMSPNSAHDVRILFHGEFCSMYLDDVWVASFAFNEDSVIWPEDNISLYLYSSGSVSVTNIIVSELFDWREAIYVESEMSAASALASVIQERPIETTPTDDGKLAFSYNIIRDSFSYTNAESKRMITSHDSIEQTSFDAGSDAIVYYRDIAFVTNENFSDNEGFLTRVFKLSSLDTGAKLAARILLQKAYERQYMHNFTMRPDIRTQIGDVITVNYLVPGTSRQQTFTVTVETLSINVREGEYYMTLTARNS